MLMYFSTANVTITSEDRVCKGHGALAGEATRTNSTYTEHLRQILLLLLLLPQCYYYGRQRRPSGALLGLTWTGDRKRDENQPRYVRARAHTQHTRHTTLRSGIHSWRPSAFQLPNLPWVGHCRQQYVDGCTRRTDGPHSNALPHTTNHTHSVYIKNGTLSMSQGTKRERRTINKK